MNWLNLIRKEKQLKPPLEKPLKLLVKTNQKGKAEVIDPETGDVYTNVRIMYMNVTSSGKVTAEITVKDIHIDMEIDVNK